MGPEMTNLQTAIDVYDGDVSQMDPVLLDRLIALCRPENISLAKTKMMQDLMQRAFYLAMAEWTRRYPDGALPPCMMEWGFPPCYDGPRHFADLSDHIN